MSAYGVRGWVKVQPHSSDAHTLLAADVWWLQAPVPPGKTGALSSPRPARVLASRPQGATVVAQLDSVPDRDCAKTMKAHTVWVSREKFPAADDDEFYWVDLIGCLLFGEHEGQPALIGQVVEVIDNGAHGILRVARATQDTAGELTFVQSDKGRVEDVLVPFVRAHVHTVDLANKRLDSNWPVEF